MEWDNILPLQWLVQDVGDLVLEVLSSNYQRNETRSREELRKRTERIEQVLPVLSFQSDNLTTGTAYV